MVFAVEHTINCPLQLFFHDRKMNQTFRLLSSKLPMMDHQNSALECKIMNQQPRRISSIKRSKLIGNQNQGNYLNRAIAIARSVDINATIIDTARLQSWEQVLDGSNAVPIRRKRGAKRRLSRDIINRCANHVRPENEVPAGAADRRKNPNSGYVAWVEPPAGSLDAVSHGLLRLARLRVEP